MHQCLCMFVFCFSSVVLSSNIKYTVPKATIKPFLSKGFSVSIPDSPGLALFAFHANINFKLGSLEAGTFSKDILQSDNGLWIFVDDSTKLNVGDVINYWIFVEKDGLGYRQELQKFVVKELYNDNQSTNVIADDILMENASVNLKQSTILSGNIHHYHHFYNETSSAAQCETENKSNEFFVKISNQLNVVLMQLQSLHDKTEPLKSKIDSLEEVIGELLKDKDNGTKLLFIGNNPPHDSNAYEAVRAVITDRLDLHDLSASIKFAEFVNGGIMFEVKHSIEKHRILIRAQERFNTDKTKIVDYCFKEKSKTNSEISGIDHRISSTEKKNVEADQSDMLVFE